MTMRPRYIYNTPYTEKQYIELTEKFSSISPTHISTFLNTTTDVIKNNCDDTEIFDLKSFDVVTNIIRAELADDPYTEIYIRSVFVEAVAPFVYQPVRTLLTFLEGFYIEYKARMSS